MKIGDIVIGLAAGVGIDLSPDEKTAYYVEWSIGELSRAEVDTGKVQTILTGLKYPEDVEVDWAVGDMFISERLGGITKVWAGGKHEVLANVGGAPQQLALAKHGGKRLLFTVCYDSGQLIRIDADSGAITVVAAGFGHPVGIAIDAAQKYAYITEQDKLSLTRVKLANGSAATLHTGLVAPFFLAWDQNATGLFCIQRDPANSLIKMTIGPPVTVQTVATGLAWRPSGVAPNKDNKRIYICADQKLQVISFNGVPVIAPGPAPFEIYSVQFNFDKSDAIPLKDPATDNYLSTPEWVTATRNEPAAYLRGTLPHLKVVFRKLVASVTGTYAVGATGNYGGIRRKYVAPNFQPSGLSDPIDCELMWPLPRVIGKHTVTLEWNARSTPAASVPVAIGSAQHTVCTTWKKPAANPAEELSSWVYKQPMLWTSEWAAGKNNEKDICDAIIHHLPQSGLKYGVSGWTVRDILTGGGGMCGGWYRMFQHLANCQGVFVNRRCYLVDWRNLANSEVKWCAIVIRAGGLNQAQPTQAPSEFHDVDAQYPIIPTTTITTVTERRYRFWGPGDGHCINFLKYGGKLYLYDPSFGTGPFEIDSFAGSQSPLPPKDFSVIGGAALASFKKNYLNGAVDYMLGSLHDGAGQFYQTASGKNGMTVKNVIIPDLVGSFAEITFSWGP